MSFVSYFFGFLLGVCCVSVYAGDDEVSIGLSACTKLDDEGQSITFVCPDSLSISKHYCCGVKNFQYCCDYDDREAFSKGAVAAVIIGIGVVLLCVLSVCCWCCSCCCFRNRQPQHIFIAQPLSTSTTIHQPMFASPGYHPLVAERNLQIAGQSQHLNQGFNVAPEPMGKPPPYTH